MVQSVLLGKGIFASLLSFLHKEHFVLTTPKFEWSIKALPEEGIKINLLIIFSGLQVFPQQFFLGLPLLFLGIASKLSDVGNHLRPGDDVDLSVGGGLGWSLLVVGGNIESHFLLHHGHITELFSCHLGGYRDSHGYL